MSKKRKATLIHLMLPLILGLAALSFIFRQNVDFQKYIIGGALFLYIIFSLIHHYFDKTLTLEVVIEYILIAGLVLIILASSVL